MVRPFRYAMNLSLKTFLKYQCFFMRAAARPIRISSFCSVPLVVRASHTHQYDYMSPDPRLLLRSVGRFTFWDWPIGLISASILTKKSSSSLQTVCGAFVSLSPGGLRTAASRSHGLRYDRCGLERKQPAGSGWRRRNLIGSRR